jgi:hypothetical protein
MPASFVVHFRLLSRAIRPLRLPILASTVAPSAGGKCGGDPSKAGVGCRPHRYAIHMVRGHRVMLDADLATLYGVETKVLLQAVHRNIQRFPADFMFQLATEGEGVAAGATFPTRSPSRAWPCSPAFCAASARSR